MSSNETYKLIEIVGTSSKSFNEAADNGVSRAAKTLRGVSWFQVSEMRGAVNDQGVSEYQVIMKVGLKLE